MKTFNELAESERDDFYQLLNNIVCSTLMCGKSLFTDNGVYHVLSALCPEGIWTSTVARVSNRAYLQLLNRYSNNCYTYEWCVMNNGDAYVRGDLDAYNDVAQITPILHEAAVRAANRIEAKI